MVERALGVKRGWEDYGLAVLGGDDQRKVVEQADNPEHDDQSEQHENVLKHDLYNGSEATIP